MRQIHSRPGQRGSMIIYIIAALAVLSVISVAATTMRSTSEMATARVNCPAAAQYLAEAGMRYAMSEIRAQADLATLTATATSLDSTTFTVTDAGTFDLTVSAPVDNGGNYEVTVSCTGTACTSEGGTASTLGAITVASNVTPAGSSNPEEINFEDDMGDIGGAGQGGDGGEDFVVVDEENNELILGNDELASFGCAWYNGDKNPCTDGVCSFGSGFRTYFEAMYSYNADGDGFVFTIINAENNTTDDCGGDSSRGELLAYGGPGISGEGLEAPKLGLEFDIYSNSGEGSVCAVGQRGDDSASRDHVAWLLWGHDYWVDGCQGTYDDNRHGAGIWSGNNPVPPSADIPTNPENIGESGDGADGYYYDEANGGDWMREYNSGNRNKEFRIRIEVDRALTPDADGNYCYTLKGWIVRDNVTMAAGYDDVSTDFYNQTDESTWPQIVHSVVLSASKHAQLEDVIFGWTASTGGATKTITFSDFKLAFKKNETTCPVVTKPTDYVMAVPMTEGQGGNLENTVTGANSWSQDAYWLKGVSCPECASRYFDDDHGPAPFWSNPAGALSNTGTVSTWVYLKDYNDYAGILMNGTTQEVLSLQFTERRLKDRGTTFRFNPDRTSGPWYRIDDGDEKPMMCITDGGGISYCINSKYQLELEKWYHLVATFDAATDEMQFFVNGTRTAHYDTQTEYGWDLPAVPTNPPWSNTMIIGALDTGGSRNFQGMIDDVYLYNRVLTDEEITALYNDGFQTAQE